MSGFWRFARHNPRADNDLRIPYKTRATIGHYEFRGHNVRFHRTRPARANPRVCPVTGCEARPTVLLFHGKARRDLRGDSRGRSVGWRGGGTGRCAAYDALALEGSRRRGCGGTRRGPGVLSLPAPGEDRAGPAQGRHVRLARAEVAHEVCRPGPVWPALAPTAASRRDDFRGGDAGSDDPLIRDAGGLPGRSRDIFARNSRLGRNGPAGPGKKRDTFARNSRRTLARRSGGCEKRVTFARNVCACRPRPESRGNCGRLGRLCSPFQTGVCRSRPRAACWADLHLDHRTAGKRRPTQPCSLTVIHYLPTYAEAR